MLPLVEVRLAPADAPWREATLGDAASAPHLLGLLETYGQRADRARAELRHLRQDAEALTPEDEEHLHAPCYLE